MLGIAVLGIVGIGGEQVQAGRFLARRLIDDAELRVDQRRELRQEQPAHGNQVTLALQHVGESGEIGLQPILLGVAVGREPQVVDHRVDVVLERGHLAARVDLNRPGQVALRHRGRDLGDGAHLRGQVRSQQVDVTGEMLPGAGCAWHVGLAAETAFHAHLACDGGDLVGEGRQRVRHVVDCLGERRHFALRFDR